VLTLILDCLFLESNLNPVFNGKSALHHLTSGIEGYDRIIVLHNGLVNDIPKGAKGVLVEDLSAINILSVILKEVKQSELAVIMNGGSPFYDKQFIDGMIDKHRKYGADYSNSIGYPDGLVPEIITKNALKQICYLLKDDNKTDRNYLFYGITKDINSFDIETVISPVDMRLYKVRIGSDDAGQCILTSSIYREAKDDGYNGIVEYINNNKAVIFTLPYTVILDITSKRLDKPIYLPELQKQSEMSLDDVEEIVSQLSNINSSCKVILGGIGDPVLHKNWVGIVKVIVKKGFDLIIETGGIELDESDLELLNEYSDQITFVVMLDAATPEVFSAVRGHNGLDVVIKTISLLRNKGFTVYRQITRLKENELEIEGFIRKKDTDNLIIRKYSNYCGFLPDRSVVDLSPVNRIPCFHLRRDIFVSADKAVPLCKYSIMSGKERGDSSSLTSIIDRQRDLFKKNVAGVYPDCCKNCSDYYIFNF